MAGLWFALGALLLVVGVALTVAYLSWLLDGRRDDEWRKDQ